MSKRLFALGRLKQGEMNKLESQYRLYLELLKSAGRILWYSFEGMKFRLADKTFYTPDFMVMLADGTLEAHEIKGAKAIFMDDAKVKVKVAAEMYPVKFVVVYPDKKNTQIPWEFVVY